MLLLLTFLGSNILFSEPGEAATLTYVEVSDTENFSSSQPEPATTATLAIATQEESNDILEKENINNLIQLSNKQNDSSECSSPYPKDQFKDPLGKQANIRLLPQVEYSMILKEVYDFTDVCEYSNNDGEIISEFLIQNNQELQMLVSMEDYYNSPIISPQKKIELENEDLEFKYSTKERIDSNYSKNYVPSYRIGSSFISNYPSRVSNLPSQVNNYPAVSLVANLANQTPEKYDTNADTIYSGSLERGNYGILASPQVQSYATPGYVNTSNTEIGKQIQENIKKQLQVSERQQKQLEKRIQKQISQMEKRKKQQERKRRQKMQQQRKRQEQMLIKRNKAAIKQY